MKTIYFGHSRLFDFENEWYKPVNALSIGADIKTILPHDVQKEGINTKELFESGCTLFVAEITFPSTGLGMELGYADMFHIPTIGFFKKGTPVSGFLKKMLVDCIEYSDVDDLQKKLQKIVSGL